MGINPLAVDSDNVTYDNPRGYYQAQRRLKRWQRAQSRRTKGSRGWWEAQRRIDSAHRRATGLRSNAHHQVSRTLVSRYHTLGIETLNVAGMIRAGCSPRPSPTPACPACWPRYATRRRRTARKSWKPAAGIPAAGHAPPAVVKRTWAGNPSGGPVPSCGVTHDRNENAARNLLKLALLAVGEDVMLPDGAALASGDSIAGETAPAEGRTKPRTTDCSQPPMAL